jgi:hypothetical protein
MSFDIRSIKLPSSLFELRRTRQDRPFDKLPTSLLWSFVGHGPSTGLRTGRTGGIGVLHSLVVPEYPENTP